MKNQVFNYLSIALLSVFLFASCSKDDDGDNPGGGSGGAAISATFEFSDGNTVDFKWSPEADDLIKPSVNGPNGNDHYKLWLRGEKTIGDHIYVINIYVTMTEEGVGNYPFGTAWQWHDKGLATEIHVGVQEKDNLLSLKQYLSGDIDNSNSKGTTITSLTENHVKGTFAGKAVFMDSDIVTITNGKFDIDIERGTWED